jgi:endoglucanase
MKLFTKFALLLALLMTATLTGAAGYRVQNGRIFDGNNQEIQLRGVNWFGFQQAGDYVVHGLWARNWRSQIRQMKNLGFNAVRLPLCQTVLQNVTPGSISYDLNPELRGKKSLELLDLVVNEFNTEGMFVLLDHHTPDCATLTQLWYTDSYSEQQWLDDLAFLADRYKNVPYVIGIDIKNEPHGAATWGTGATTDWKLAAERAANRILAVAPEMLIFVEGIEDNPTCSTYGHWWGGNFEPLNCYPLNIPADRLVLSPHVYGPDVYNQTYFNDPTFPNNLPAIWDLHFGQFAPQYAVVIGEFGGKYGHGGDPKDVVWQNKIVDYMIEKNLRSSFYWSWNPNSTDTGGILQNDWQNVWQDKVDLLHRLWSYMPQPPVYSCSDGRDNDSDGLTDFPNDPGCANAQDDDEYNIQQGSQGLNVVTTTNNDWGSGYCKEMRVTNTNSFPIDWLINIPVEGNVTSIWNAVYTQNGNDIAVGGASWNDILQAGQAASFGFCVQRPPKPKFACNDGADNDGDGLIDMNDPGCSSPEDTDEYNAPTGGGLTTTVSKTADWGSGYCADVAVKNTTANPIDWVVSFTIEGRVSSLWNANYSQNGNVVTAEGVSWNNIVQAGGTITFGFCAVR